MGDLVGIIGGLDGFPTLLQSLVQRLVAGYGIGHIMEGLGDGGVVAGYRLEVVRLGSGQLAVESSGGEQRQVERRADAAHIGAGLTEIVEPQRLGASTWRTEPRVSRPLS